MERYNILIEDNGIRILKTKSYLSLLQQNPGFSHENVGDLYSETTRSGLASKVSEILNNFTGIKGDLEINEFCDVPSNPGVKITYLETEELVSISDPLVLFLMEQLISDYSKGSVAHSFKKTIKEVNDCMREYGKLMTGITAITKRIVEDYKKNS